jgi:UDP-glucuronate decarboxylase
MFNLISDSSKNIIKTIDYSSLKNKKILITGATGLIGLHMVSLFKEIKKHTNIEIYCWIHSIPESNIRKFFDGCVVIQSDLTNTKNIDDLQQQLLDNLSGFDIIIHAACYGQPQKFMKDQLKTIDLNTKTTKDLFKLLNLNGTFLYCSTSEIYSGIDEENITETMIGTTTPDHPRACYIESKRCGEAICNAFALQGYNIKIARISLAYGPGTKKDDARVLNNFIQKAIQNKKIELLDDGSSLRTYGYIEDIIEMLVNILLHGKQKIYNISGVSKISILELANVIGNLMNCTVVAPTTEQNTLAGNPKTVNLSLDKYNEEFNKKEFIPINEGLLQTINWQKSLYYE